MLFLLQTFSEMKFISTSNALLKAGFKEAVLSGLAADGGLYVPEQIPEIKDQFFTELHCLTTHELAFQLLFPFVNEDLTEDQLKRIIECTFQFDFPLVHLPSSGIQILELFHGPTWAFKDVGARFLAACLSTWSGGNQKQIILVATSGDTGGAVANGFFKQDGIEVVILYPKDKISPLQEYQIAGLGGNITALAVDGTFDDCQRMVKSAFNDKVLRSGINITSANSINIARWLPQMIWYAVAWKAMQREGVDTSVSIPSGNYGNIAAAFLACAMGLQFKEILAAHNANDTIPRFLHYGIYSPGMTISTLANAMDVSDPSNFVRLRYLKQFEASEFTPAFSAETVSDDQIIEAIRTCWKRHQYLLDPHTATAWYVLNQKGANGIVVSTAHPFKFKEVIIKALGFYPDAWNKSWVDAQINYITIPATYSALEEFLFHNLSD
jgi:threonine synthase